MKLTYNEGLILYFVSNFGEDGIVIFFLFIKVLIIKESLSILLYKILLNIINYFI